MKQPGMLVVIDCNRNLDVTTTINRSTFQVNKRDHKIYLRDKQNLETRLERKQFEDQPHSMFKDANIPFGEETRTCGK